MTVKRIGQKKARVELTRILKRVQKDREVFLICNHGKQVALLIPFDALPGMKP